MDSKCKKGYKLQDGKCIKKKGFLMSSKSGKSYNPLKMWGSYVGALLGIIWIVLVISKGCFENCGLFYGTPMLLIMIFQSVYLTGALIIILCFLIGWGIHSLIRRLRK